MSKICVEVPKTTNMATMSIPCGEGEQFLWQFTVIFEESEYLQQRIVSIMDKLVNEEPSVQSQIVTNKNDRIAEFEYHHDCSDLKANITIRVFFCKETRIIAVEW